MDRKRISALTEQLNTLSKENQQVEYWLARELQHCLGYRTWENFEAVILGPWCPRKRRALPWKIIFVRSRN